MGSFGCFCLCHFFVRVGKVLMESELITVIKDYVVAMSFSWLLVSMREASHRFFRSARSLIT